MSSLEGDGVAVLQGSLRKALPGPDGRTQWNEFEKLVEEVSRAEPLLRAPIVRPLGLGAPIYRTAAATRCATPPVTIHEAADPRGETLPQIFAQRLNQPRSRRNGELLRFEAFGAGFTWGSALIKY